MRACAFLLWHVHAVVDEGGTNFSMGQRQLFCLARAILKNNEILVSSMCGRCTSGLSIRIVDVVCMLCVRTYVCTSAGWLTKRVWCPWQVLDEATSNVDVATDRVIQRVIRSRFASRTVVTIAHRLHTIIDCDRILVLERGQVEELDTPYNLLRNHFEPPEQMVGHPAHEDSDSDGEHVTISKGHGFATLVAETGHATAEALWHQVRDLHRGNKNIKSQRSVDHI